MKSKFDPILSFIAAFAAGILLASFLTPSLLLGVFVTLGVASLIGAYAYFRGSLLFILCILSIGFSFGLVRTELSEIPHLDPTLQHNLEESVVLTGVVVEEPDTREKNTLLVVKLKKLEEAAVKGKVLIGVDQFLPIGYGDEVKLTGKLEAPENFETDSGNVFNYVAYLDKDDIHYRMWYPQVEVLREGEGNPVISVLLSIKHSFLNRLALIFPEPHVSLLSGLLLGAKQSLGDELLDAFRITGLIHVVVLSGYNLTLVAEAVRWLASRFIARSAIAAFVAGGAIVLFSLMAGAGATVVRATAMALLVLIAKESGRVYEVIRALFITGFLMLIWNPKLLSYDPSFELSFLATFGLIVVAPKLEKYLPFITEKLQLRSLVAATLGTQAVVLPLLLYQTGMISIIGVVANLLVLPLIPTTMLLGFASGVLAFIHPWIAFPVTTVTQMLLSYELWIAETFSSLPLASISITNFPWWGMVLLYGIGLVAYLKIFSTRRPGRSIN